jgi:hypothetical protein
MYLTEKSLKDLLKQLYPNEDFIHDKAVPNSKNKRRRPDYRSDNLMLIVEFDGASHYQSTSRILADKAKDEDYTSLGYKVVRIPYFIQPNTYTLEVLFGVGIGYEEQYPQGFIDKKAVLPSDFCYKGIKRFEEDLDRFPLIKYEIVKSLRDKIATLECDELVLPHPLTYLIN